MKCSVYIATSVDGFIAKPDGGIEWLHRPEYSVSGMKGLSYDEFISTVDAIVMGRNTYEKALTFNGWPYEGTLVVVLTSRDMVVPDDLKGKIKVESGSPEKIVSKLSSEGKKHLYIDGGITIQKFLEARLIHELTITKIPILLGSGIPLFGSSDVEQPLQLIEAIPSENGFVQERYKVQQGDFQQ